MSFNPLGFVGDIFKGVGDIVNSVVHTIEKTVEDSPGGQFVENLLGIHTQDESASAQANNVTPTPSYADTKKDPDMRPVRG